MRTFPKLLQLPFLALERVISSLPLMELLELSQCSSKTGQIVKSSIFPQDSVELVFSMKCADIAFCVITDSRTEQRFWIHVIKDDVLKVEVNQECEERQFLGRDLRMKKFEDNYVVVSVPSDILQLAGELTDKLFEFFKVKPNKFSMSLFSTSFFENLKKWPGAQRALGNWTEFGDFDCATLAKYLEVNGRENMDFTYFGELKDAQNLTIAHFPIAFEKFRTMSHYITPNVLMNLDAQEIELFFGNKSFHWKPEYFRIFIKKWLTDVDFHKNLESFHFTSVNIPLNLLSTEVLQGVPCWEIDASRPDKPKLIRRPADGKFATIIIKEHSFQFDVIC